MPESVALITGAGKRVGRAITMACAKAGYDIAVHYRGSEAEAEDTAAAVRERGRQADTFQADLTVTADVNALVAAVLARFGRLDLVVASAAVFKRTAWPDIDDDDWDYHLNSNLKSSFLLARAAAPRMDDGGSIVTVADWTGLRPQRHYLPYCVSKAGVIALTKALAIELAPRLRVNCVCPGTVLPPPHADAAARERMARMAPLERIGSPEDVAAAILFLAQGTDFATGTILPVDGGRLVADSGFAYDG